MYYSVVLNKLSLISHPNCKSSWIELFISNKPLLESIYYNKLYRQPKITNKRVQEYLLFFFNYPTYIFNLIRVQINGNLEIFMRDIINAYNRPILEGQGTFFIQLFRIGQHVVIFHILIPAGRPLYYYSSHGQQCPWYRELTVIIQWFLVKLKIENETYVVVMSSRTSCYDGGRLFQCYCKKKHVHYIQSYIYNTNWLYWFFNILP